MGWMNGHIDLSRIIVGCMIGDRTLRRSLLVVLNISTISIAHSYRNKSLRVAVVAFMVQFV
jgi:hypothetical protein